MTSLERDYLDHILSHLKGRDPDDSILKTMMNSWFAHYAGRPFLDGNSKPLWLSRQGSKKILAGHLHGCSAEARIAIGAARYRDTVIDHSIPLAVLVTMLRTNSFSDREELRQFLAKRFTLALLTNAEHDVQLAPYKSCMTADWSDDAFAADEAVRWCRYNRAGIEFTVQRLH